MGDSFIGQHHVEQLINGLGGTKVLMGHGDNEQEVFSELCRIVEETIELYRQDGRPLSSPT